MASLGRGHEGARAGSGVKEGSQKLNASLVAIFSGGAKA